MSEVRTGGQGGDGTTPLVAHGTRQLVVAVVLTALLVGSVVLVLAAGARVGAAGEKDNVQPADVVLMVVGIWVAVIFGLLLPVGISLARQARFRILVGPEAITLRDGRTVAWRDVARIGSDPMSPDRVLLWLVERSTPPPPSGPPLEQPNPVAVTLRGLAETHEQARAIIEEHWRRALA